MEKMNTQACFIVLDDDPINNVICSKYIELVFPGAPIQTFTHAAKALEYIQAAYIGAENKKTVLFLDLSMPILSGWDVLDRFAAFPENVRQQFSIYILTSSISFDDKNRAKKNPLVCGFIEKPISVEQIEALNIMAAK